jgi:hypothetical protein
MQWCDVQGRVEQGEGRAVGSRQSIAENSSLEKMMGFVRRRPVLLVGGALALMFLVSKVLKSGRREGADTGYGESEYERLRRQSAQQWGGYRPATGWSAAEPSPEPVRRPTETAPGVGPT